MSEDSKQKSKAFELYELRKEIMEIDYKLKLVEKNCSTLNINLRKNEVVQKEIEKLDPNTRVFDRCGRIFVLSNKDKMIELLGEDGTIDLINIETEEVTPNIDIITVNAKTSY